LPAGGQQAEKDMDNLTHSLVGLAASKAGLERLSPHTTALCIVAANAPDSDIVALLFGGRWSFLQHHRGISHSILGTAMLALVVPFLFFVVDYLLAKIRSRAPGINLRGLLLASIVVSATHPFLDWTNNYGIRLLLPWSPKWFYGDLVFIVDPFIWVITGGAAFLLTSKTRRQTVLWTLLALVVTTIVMLGTRSRITSSSLVSLRVSWIVAMLLLLILFRLRLADRWRGKLAIAAFIVLILYLGGLSVLHRKAVNDAEHRASEIALQNNESVVGLAAMPKLADPFRWQCVLTTDRAGYRFEISSLIGNQATSSVTRFEMPDALSSTAIAEATQDPRAQVFLGFARFPMTRVVDVDCATQTLVQFADLRYTEPGQRSGAFSLEVPIDCEPGNKGSPAKTSGVTK